MEFETLKKDNRKYWIIGSIAIILFGSVMFFMGTRANYRVTQKVNIANGIINWSPSDLDIMTIKLSSDRSNYTDADRVPSSGYTLNTEKSTCKLNGANDSSITIEYNYNNGKVLFSNLKKGSKCYLYFDEMVAKDQILANKTISTRTDFSSVLTENTTGKIYTAEDNNGTSYYFAGAVDNNWVKFGGFYWRIVRINGDGTIRLIYNGTTTDQTGTGTQINGTTYKYSHKDAYYNGTIDNAYVKDNAYVGYMYGTIGASTYAATHKNTTDSYVKQIVDNWYNTNLNKTGIKEHIDATAGFCGDRSLASGTGVGGTATDYGAKNRLNTNKTPSLKCTNTNDLYTTTSSNKGNKALTYPVGLITADEVAYAGGVYANSNQSYYLYTGQYYWTMSPHSFDGGPWTVMFYVQSSLSNYRVGSAAGVRPVINLKSDSKFKAGTDGTTTKPYEVV